MKNKSLFLVVIAMFLMAGCSPKGILGDNTPNTPNLGPTSVQPTSVAPMATSVVQPTAGKSLPTLPAPTSAPLVPVVQSTSVPSGDMKSMYNVPGNFMILPGMNGVFYSVMTEPPFEVQYVYGQTVIIAAGNLTVDGTKVYQTDKKGTVGNVHADVCKKTEGCKATLTGYKAGHVGVTIVDGGTELPSESVACALNTQLTGANNCGNKCLTVFLGYGDSSDKQKFTSEVNPSDVKLSEAATPYPVAMPKAEGVPTGANVLFDTDGSPIGFTFFLAEKISYITVPETGETIVLCADKCSINGKAYNGNSVVEFVGKTDGKTPKDLNGTLKIEAGANPSMIQLYVFYAGDFVTKVTELRSQYKDWSWIK